MAMDNHGENHDQPNGALPLRRWEAALLLLILLFGVWIRVSYLAELAGHPENLVPGKDQVDMAFFDEYGRRVARHVRDALGLPAPAPDPRLPALVAPWQQHDNEPFVRPPGYSLFIAGACLATGDSEIGLRALQMCMGMGSVLLGWWLARRLTGRWGGLLLALFMAGYWTLIVYEGEAHSPSLMIFLSLLFIHALLNWRRRPGAARAAIVGFALAAYALTAPAILLFIPVAALWMAAVNPPRTRAALAGLAASWAALAAAFGVSILPFTVANYRADGHVQLISAGAGVLLLYGNWDGADGTFKTPKNVFPFPLTDDHETNMRAVEEHFGRRPSFAEMSDYAIRLAVGHIRQHPWEFARLTVRRVLLFWGPWEISHNVMEYCTWRFSPVLRRLPGNFAALFALAVAGLAFFAAAALRRRAGAGSPHGDDPAGLGLVLLLILVWFAPYAVFYATAHYRVPLLPYVGVFSVYAVVSTCRALPARDWRCVICVLPGAAVYAASLMVPVSYEKDVERWYYFRITPLAEHGDLNGALRASANVVNSGMNSPTAWLHHGDLLLDAGRSGEALAAYARALGNGPSDADSAAWGRIGSVRFDSGDKDGAAAAFDKALARDGHNFEALLGMARILLDRARPAEAVPLLERAAVEKPEKSNTFFLLGLAMRQLGKSDAAEAAFRKGMEADPKDVWPRIGLADLLEAQGRIEEAHEIYVTAQKMDPANRQAAEGVDRTAPSR